MLTSIIQDSRKATLKLHKKRGKEEASLIFFFSSFFFRLIDLHFVPLQRNMDILKTLVLVIASDSSAEEVGY